MVSGPVPDSARIVSTSLWVELPEEEAVPHPLIKPKEQTITNNNRPRERRAKLPSSTSVNSPKVSPFVGALPECPSPISAMRPIFNVEIPLPFNVFGEKRQACPSGKPPAQDS